MGDVDLSGGQYDELERKLSEYLGIKVFLVKDWETPQSYMTAESNKMIDSMYPGAYGIKNARQAFEEATRSMLGSLRANIAARDPVLGAELTDRELLSLQKVRHVTVRDGNAEPERAVIIFDPANVHDESDKTWNKNIYWALFKHSGDSNAWHHPGPREEDDQYIFIRDIVENLDVSPDDLRAYQAFRNVMYAVKNQDEFSMREQSRRDGPHFQRLRNLHSNDRMPGMHRSEHEITLYEHLGRLEVEQALRYAADDIGIQDPDFLEKLKIGRATHDFGTSLFPGETFARLMLTDRRFEGLGPNELVAIHMDLHRRLDEGLKRHTTPEAEDIDLDGDYLLMTRSDPRIMFPVFREVYEADTSTGPARVYLDTIMAGLQKFFPTLTNAPVPVLDPKNEPPRTVAGYKAPTQGTPQPPPPGPV